MEMVPLTMMSDDVDMEVGPSTTSVEYRLAELLAGLMKDELSAQDVVLDARQVTLVTAKQYRQEASTQLHRAARHMNLRAAAEQLECEACTWNLVYHLLCSLNETTLGAATGLGGPMLLGCDSKLTRRQLAAEAVGLDDTLARCARVVAWLEAEADSALTVAGPQYFSTTDGIWQDTLVQRGQGNIAKALDFDAPFREGRALGASDAKAQERFMARLWQLLRAGRMDLALKLCTEVGQPWRAASLTGGGGFGPLPVGNAAYAQDAFMLVDYQAEDLACEIDVGLGDREAMWKWSCYMIAEQTAQAIAGSKFEAAVYGALCGHVMRVLPVCTSWHDKAWAYSRSWLDLTVDSKLSTLVSNPEEPVDFHLIMSTLAQSKDGALSEDQQSSLQEGLAVASGSWPIPQLASSLPPVFEGIFMEVLSNAESDVGFSGQSMSQNSQGGNNTLRGSSRQGVGDAAPRVQHIRLQTDLVLQDGEMLLTQHLWPWLAQHQAELAVAQVDVEGSVPSSPAYLMLRFAAHLVLSLKALGFLNNQDINGAQGTFSILADCCNHILHAYANQLKLRRLFNLLPLYVVHLRPPLRMTYINHLFTDFTRNKADDSECLRLYEWVARWFRLVYERQLGGEHQMSSGLMTNMRPAELEDIVLTIVGDAREDTSQGPLHRVRIARWLLYPFVIWQQMQLEQAAAAATGSSTPRRTPISTPPGPSTPRSLHPEREARDQAEEAGVQIEEEGRLLQHSLFVCVQLSLLCRQMALGGEPARACVGVLVSEVVPREFLEFVHQRAVGHEMEGEAAELLQWCNFFNLQARWNEWRAGCRVLLLEREQAATGSEAPQENTQAQTAQEMSTSGRQLLGEFVQQLESSSSSFPYWVPTREDIISAMSQADVSNPIQLRMLLSLRAPDSLDEQPDLDSFTSLTGAQLTELQDKVNQELGAGLPAAAQLDVGVGPSGKLVAAEQVQGVEVLVALPGDSSEEDVGTMVAAIANLLCEEDVYNDGEDGITGIQVMNLDSDPLNLGLCVAKTCCLSYLVITAAKLVRALVRLGADLSVGDDLLEVIGGSVEHLDVMLNAIPPSVLQQVHQLLNDAYIFHLHDNPPVVDGNV